MRYTEKELQEMDISICYEEGTVVTDQHFIGLFSKDKTFAFKYVARLSFPYYDTPERGFVEIEDDEPPEDKLIISMDFHNPKGIPPDEIYELFHAVDDVTFGEIVKLESASGRIDETGEQGEVEKQGGEGDR